jgi:putative hemolysin
MNIFLEILLIFLLLLANGIFAMAEIAVVSSRKARLKKFADEGSAKAQAALALAQHPDRFLSAVQVGIRPNSPYR